MRLTHTYKRASSAELSWIVLRLVIGWAVVALLVIGLVVASSVTAPTVQVQPTVVTAP